MKKALEILNQTYIDDSNTLCIPSNFSPLDVFNAIQELQEAMNRTCEGCEYVIKYPNGCHECCLLTYADQEGCTSCIEVDKDFYCNKYKPKDNE